MYKTRGGYQEKSGRAPPHAKEIVRLFRTNTFPNQASAFSPKKYKDTVACAVSTLASPMRRKSAATAAQVRVKPARPKAS
jgi:hypothetical protein